MKSEVLVLFNNRVGSIHNEIYESDSPRVDVIKLSLAMAYTDYKNAYDSLTSPVSRLRQRIEQLFLSSDEPSILLRENTFLMTKCNPRQNKVDLFKNRGKLTE